MKFNFRNPFLATILLVAASSHVHADTFDTNSTGSSFGVANGSTYDWWTASYWSDAPGPTYTTNDNGTAATVTWQGLSSNNQQAYFVGAGAGTTYTVRLGSTGSTDTYIQNIAINVKADGTGLLSGAAGNVTIGTAGDTGKLILSANNSIGAQNGGTLTINNGIDLNAKILNYRGGNIVINGSIIGTGASNIALGSGFGLSSGTFTLAGSNSFAGSTTVNSGYVLRLRHANALGATGGTNTVNSGGTLEVDSGASISSGESVSIAGDGSSSFGALRAGTGGGTWAGGVTLSGAGSGPRLGATAGNTLTITGTIADGSGNSFNISGQSGTGVVLLNPTSSNSYTGTTGIIRGILRLGKTDALPTGTTLNVDSIDTVPDAATFDMAGFNQTVAALQDSATTDINGKITNSLAASSSTLTVNQASNTTFDGVIENGSGSVILTKSGVGNLTLNGANTFTGGTNIQNGKVIIGGGNDRLAASGSVSIGSVANTGALVLGDGTNARNQTLAGLTATGLGGSVVGNAAANSTLTLAIASGTNTFSGTLGGAGTNENNLALTKTGAGTLELTNANTHVGGTNANGGVILASNTGALGTAGRIVSFNSGIVEFATDTSANPYVLNFGSGNTGTVVVNRATSGSTMTHTMGIATFGNATLNIQKGANVTGTATLEFTGINMTAGAPGLSTGTMLNPTTAKVLVSGNITRSGGSSNLLTLDGTSSGNLISGIISGSQALTKSNISSWELSNANTFTGNTKVTGGTLVLSHSLALQNSAFDTSGAGTLDTTTVNTPTFGGLTSATDYSISSNVTSLTLNPGTDITRTYTGNLGGGAVGMTLTKSGAGTQVLGGTNSYSGLTSVNGGELNIQSAGAIGGSNVTVASGAQLALQGGVTVSGKTITTSGSGRASGTGAFFGGLQSVSGTNEWAGNVVLGADLSRIGARKNATLVVSGAIDDGASTFGLVVRNENFGNNNNGAGNANTVVVLSGASTYGGNTQLIHGLTKLDGGDNRLPVGTVLQFGLGATNAKFDMNGRNQELAGLAVTSSSTDANRDWNANELTNSSATQSTLTLNTTANQSFGGNLTNNTGIITGNIALEKSGSATLTLSGSNSYTGATTIHTGTLALGTGGSISASTTIDVKGSATLNVSALAGWALANGQTLKGNGTVDAGGTGKTVTISNGAFLAPGASPGTLLINGDLALASGSTFAAEVQTSGSPTGDLVNVAGDLDLISGALLDLGLFNTDATLSTGTKFSLFSYSGAWNSGIFTGYADDSDFVLGLNQFRINYDDLSGGVNGGAYSNYVTLTVVPEPRAALLAGIGMLALLRRRRPQAR